MQTVLCILRRLAVRGTAKLPELGGAVLEQPSAKSSKKRYQRDIKLTSIACLYLGQDLRVTFLVLR